MDRDEFTIRQEHLKLLQRMYVRYNDYAEFGAPEIDPKRPYGNSGPSIYEDMADALGWEYTDYADLRAHEIERLNEWHKETAIALQICLYRQKFETGSFYKPEEYNDRVWKKKP